MTQHTFQQKDELVVLKVFFIEHGLFMQEYCCRRLQLPRGEVQHTDDLREEIISVATNYSIPSPLLCFSSLFSLSPSLLSASTNPNVTALQKQVSPPLWVLQGCVIQMPVIKFTKKLHIDNGKHKDVAAAANWCAFCFDSSPSVNPCRRRN